MKKKILLVTFSDNSDHQDTLFGMYEQLVATEEVVLLAIKEPKVELTRAQTTWLVDCPKNPGICKKTFDISLLFSLIARIRKEKFDVIYFESLHVWNLPIMVFASRGGITYQVIHEVIPHEGDRQEKMVDLMNKVVSHLADVIVLRNSTYRQLMKKRYHIADNRVKYLELWRRYPEYTKPVNSKRVLFFGRMNPYKGVDNLLEIVRMCPDVQFDIVGRPDLQVRDTIEALGQEPNVSLYTEYVTDEQMRLAFIGADWLIVPYNSASQSGIIIDAYKYSRPVIAFSVGAIPEQIEDGKSGYLISEKENQQFAEKIKEVMQMPETEYENMCQYAYAYGSKKYAAHGAKKRFEELIENE